jgi:transposase
MSNKDLHRHDLTDERWSILAPILPGQRGQWGGIAKDNRLFMNAILWILRTGAPWRDLPKEFGKWSSVHQRFRRWQRRYGPHNTKIHLAVDALGMPIRAIVTDGPRADCKEAIPLIQNLPCRVLLADRGYDSDEIVEHAKNSGIQPIIPPKKNRKIQRKYDKNLYKKRHPVENAFLRLKRSWRGIATRYLKRLSSFVAFVHLACAMDWLKFITLTRVDRL